MAKRKSESPKPPEATAAKPAPTQPAPAKPHAAAASAPTRRGRITTELGDVRIIMVKKHPNNNPVKSVIDGDRVGTATPLWAAYDEFWEMMIGCDIVGAEDDEFSVFTCSENPSHDHTELTDWFRIDIGDVLIQSVTQDANYTFIHGQTSAGRNIYLHRPANQYAYWSSKLGCTIEKAKSDNEPRVQCGENPSHTHFPLLSGVYSVKCPPPGGTSSSPA